MPVEPGERMIGLELEHAGEQGLGAFSPVSLSFSSDGTLWAIAVCNICSIPWDVKVLMTIDLETGGDELRGAGWLDGAIRGLAIAHHTTRLAQQPVLVD